MKVGGGTCGREDIRVRELIEVGGVVDAFDLDGDGSRSLPGKNIGDITQSQHVSLTAEVLNQDLAPWISQTTSNTPLYKLRSCSRSLSNVQVSLTQSRM